MIGDQRISAISRRTDPQARVDDDWFDRVEYGISQASGYVLLAAAAVAGFVLIF